MSGFSAQWLELREPADHASIDKGLRDQVAQYFRGWATLAITDLGSGSGSSLRSLSPFLPDEQNWRLVDYDAELLDHARTSLQDWADEARTDGAKLQLRKGSKRIHVEFLSADLADGLSAAVLDGAGIVTASAFFDLVSPQWIAAFCRTLQAHALPLYAMLTYDGIEKWRPAHPVDASMLPAFHRDQHADKGFGPAAGPDAAPVMMRELQSLHFHAASASSPWQLDMTHYPDLIRELANGSARAVAAGGIVSSADVESWRQARVNAQGCTIGHQDIFAHM